MTNNIPNDPLSVPLTIDDGQATKRQLRRRYYRALNYLSIFGFIIIVYGGALVTDYLLFSLMWWLLQSDVQKYPLVAKGFDYAKIGLAWLFIVGAFLHGIISTYSQVKLDLALFHESDEKK